MNKQTTKKLQNLCNRKKLNKTYNIKTKIKKVII